MRTAGTGIRIENGLNTQGGILNNNNGPGSFYQSTGPQYIFHCCQWYRGARHVADLCNEEIEVASSASGQAPPNHVPSHDDMVPEREVPQPYQTTMDSLSELQRQFGLLLQVFPRSSSVVSLHSILNDFSTVVGCAGRAVAVIRRVSPKLLSHSFFTDLEGRAFQCVVHMKALQKRVSDHDVLQHTTSCEEDKSSADCTWPSLSYDIRRHIRTNRRFMYTFLRFITNPEFLRIVGRAGGELKYITRDLSPPEDLHHYSVDTIWVRKPTGMDWYSIPLRLCRTWTDFAIVLYHCFTHGPEGDYIRRGSFEIIHNHDIVDTAMFSRFIRPEMRFDIVGIASC
ncbi:hypothetical protein AB1N83_012241 [Pleurotus pulmonarius]